jgi:hypothetical protein
MEGGQSFVTVTLIASLAILGALFGPTKLGGSQLDTTTVQGPVVVKFPFTL